MTVKPAAGKCDGVAIGPPALTICMHWLDYQTPDPGDRWPSEQFLEVAGGREDSD